MKTCSHCKENKQEADFAKKNNGLQSRCRKCHSLFTKRHYQENKQVYKDRARRQRLEAKEVLREIVKTAKAVPCADCQKTYPSYVMDFDHLRNKSFTISEKVAGYGVGVGKLKEEIAKCEVVCANCHRVRTYKRSCSSAG